MLFPALLHMLFDPEKKGPSEFTTRTIIMSILFTYVQSASPRERVGRAAALVKMLRDPEPDEDKRPVPFVLEMRRERPYRVWCKEVVSVTKEVFWIFLHNMNVVSLPKTDKAAADNDTPTGTATTTAPPDEDGDIAYQLRHFPTERPPVPAAPYVGGVEWEATNYLASHLDLLNALLACTPGGPSARNALRELLRVSGWERCLGGSLRTCKEKFYGAVHDGLRTWVAAAHADGWSVTDVRFGPAPPTQQASMPGTPQQASPKKKKKKQDQALPPRIDMPKLDLLPALDVPPLVGAGNSSVPGAEAGGRGDADMWQ